MEIDQTTPIGGHRVAASKIVKTTMHADHFLLNTSHTQTTVRIVVSEALVLTTRFIGASVFHRSTATGNTWWTTGVVTT